jgi:hypothetical protein
MALRPVQPHKRINTHPHAEEKKKTLIELYEAWNKPEKAEKWRAKLEQIKDTED